MIIAVASGKGGTGKTTIAVNLALSLDGVQLIDCDVEEPNAHLFLKPEIQQVEKVNVLVPQVNLQLCDFCGQCAEFCQFNALAVFEDKVLVFPEICHNCGGCKLVCPHKAISEYEKPIGEIRKGKTEMIDFMDGFLNIAHPIPVPVIAQLKDQISQDTSVIIDCPPGTSCSMIETIEGSDFCLLVTEPTPFGLHDLELAVEVVKKMNIRFGVIINQSDIGDNKVKEYCNNNSIDILMEIPYSRKIAEAYSDGVSIITALPEYKNKFKALMNRIKDKCL